MRRNRFTGRLRASKYLLTESFAQTFSELTAENIICRFNSSLGVRLFCITEIDSVINAIVLKTRKLQLNTTNPRFLRLMLKHSGLKSSQRNDQQTDRLSSRHFASPL